MKRLAVLSSFAIIFAMLVSSVSSYFPVSANTAPAPAPSIIPLPVSMTTNGDTYVLASSANIVVTSGGDPAVAVANDLAAILRPSTGYALPVSQGIAASGDIALDLSGASSLGAEGYTLNVTAGGVVMEAYQPAGLFYGMQTIRQLLPPWIESKSVQPGPWTMTGVNITDYPRYQYRGMQLDIARHFEPYTAAEQLIDELAAFKINVLHLHVSDDQGFRIVINGRPELTDIGSQYSIGTSGRQTDPGGYWTQAQYMDVVNYAAAHFMTVMPEVDSPGHNNAIIMSYNTGPTPPYPVYPDINCSTNNPPVWNETGAVGYSAMCPTSANTWAIYTDIITQLAGMSSSPYYDMGGDEVTSITTPVYNAFVNQEAGIVRSVGKQPFGWADISSANFTPSDSPVGVGEFWNNGVTVSNSSGDTGRAAVAKGMKVVMAPADHTYLDMKYPGAPSNSLGQTWAGSLDISAFYNWAGSVSNPATFIGSRNVSTTTSAAAAIGDTNIKVSSVSGFLPFIPLTVGTGGTLETVNVTSVGTASASTTLAYPAAIGDTTANVASVTNLGVGSSLAIDTGANLENVTISAVGTAAGSATTLFAPAAIGDTNVSVTSVSGFAVGQPMSVDSGANLERVTVSAVGTQGRATTLSAASAIGATNIKVASVSNLVVGGTLNIDTGANLETATILTVGTSGSGGTGLTLTAPLTLAHASGVAVRMRGTGITFTPALALAHAQAAATRGLGTGVTFTPALTLVHASAATVFSSGTGITFTPALAQAHASASAVAQTLPAVTDANILGVEAPIWSETLVTMNDVNYQVFPRLPATAEIGWSPAYDAVNAPNRTLASFEAREAVRGAAWQIQGTNFYSSPQVAWRVDLAAPDQSLTASNFSGAVATVAAPGATLASLTATINWGDTSSSAGTFSGTEKTSTAINSLYTVNASHTYAASGTYHASITVSKTGSTATANFDVNVVLLPQTTSFTSTAPIHAEVAGATYTPTAGATSGLPVAFTIDASASSVCSISGGVVSFTAAGTCVIDANQPGNTSYDPAPQVQQSFPVYQDMLVSPLGASGDAVDWGGITPNTFRWTGEPGATQYRLDVVGASTITNIFYNLGSGPNLVNCDGSLNCTLSPTATASLAAGTYTWKVQDSGSYGPGAWSSTGTFTLGACYSLTTAVSPSGSGTVTPAGGTTCTGGSYKPGTTVSLTASPASGYVFSNWSGNASGTTSPVSVVMSGNKSVTANFRVSATSVLVSPMGASGDADDWGSITPNTFAWTGVAGATQYRVNVVNGATIINTVYSLGSGANLVSCDGALNCTLSPTGTASLAAGTYTWKVQDIGAYGTGNWSSTGTFTLGACYSLTTAVSPSGTGTVTPSGATCTNGNYKAGTTVSLTAAPASGNIFSNWSGSASGTANPGSVVMSGNKSVTANFRAPLVILVGYDAGTNTFSWTGVNGATQYRLNVTGATTITNAFYTVGAGVGQVHCDGALNCTLSPAATAGLASGSYTWKVQDSGVYGSGTWTATMPITIP